MATSPSTTKTDDTMTVSDLIILPPLEERWELDNLIVRPNIAFFSEAIYDLSGGVVEPSGKTLHMPNPESLGENNSGRQMIQSLPGGAGLDGEALIAKARTVAPTFETLLGAVIQKVMDCEADLSMAIPTSPKSSFITICSVDGDIRFLSGSRDSKAWYFFCTPVDLDKELSPGITLLLPTEVVTS